MNHGPWRRIRILSWIAVIGCLGLVVIGLRALFLIPTQPGGLLPLSEVLELAAVIALQLAIGFLLKKTPCPSCRGPFFQSPMNRFLVHPLTPRCQFCGVEKNAELSDRGKS